MKIKFLPLIAVLFAATSIMTSCLDNDVEQITYTSETSITGFSLGTLNIDRIGKDKNGLDSPYVDTLDCSNYPFTIDQINRTITNKDSLPVGTHIDKVITSITYDAGMLGYKPKGSDHDTIWTSTDSIDFTDPVEFKVYAYSGVEGKPYKVTINVHKQEPDTISWKKFDTQPFKAGSLSEQKAVYANGKVYVFGKNGNGTHIEYSDVANDNPSSWTPVTINITDVDTYSATAWAGNIYFLAGAPKAKQLYKLNVTTDEIEPVGTETFEMLIGGNDIKSELYVVKDGESGIYKESPWTKDTDPFTQFKAGQPFFSNTTTASYNSNITTTVALCYNQGNTANDTTALVFNRISSDNKWEERMQNLPLPNLENVTMIYYDGKLYAFGGGYKEIKPFSQFYCSTDNGLCWRPVTECMAFPAEFSELYTAHSKNYSCAVTPKLESETSRGNFIWIVWEDGSICRGRINRLGFTPKW
ncbi:MAG: PQQ-like beta-propeller repeat protein [Bacteroides sp.]|nr:PQQ-like beta-propeller repeat protein [Bacteroides sp.]